MSNTKRTIISTALFFGLGLFLIAVPKFSSVLAQSATLSLSPATGTYAKNQEFTLTIMCNSGTAQVEGVDALLQYDNTKLSVVSGASNATYFPSYQGTSETASIYHVFVAIVQGTEGPSGSFAAGTIKFRALQEVNSTAVSFVTGNSDPTLNSVVASDAENILSSTSGGTYVISGVLPYGGVAFKDYSLYLAGLLFFVASFLILNIIRKKEWNIR